MRCKASSRVSTSTVSARITWKPSPGVGAGVRLFETAGFSNEVNLWIENLTNQLYAEFSNATFFRPEPGRTLKVSYRVKF